MDIRFIKRLQKVKETLGKTLSEISSDIGLSQSYLSGIFWGKSNPNLEFFTKMGKVYNISCDWLLFGEGDMYLKSSVNSIAKNKFNIEREIVKDVLSNLLSDDTLFNEAILRLRLKK